MEERKFPGRYLVILLALLSISCLAVVVLSKDLHEAHVLLNQRGIFQVPAIAYDLSLELFKTIFIGICLGVGVEIYLKKLKGDSTKVMLEKSGIVKIYSSRQEAKPRFEQLVDDPKVKNIYIAGISLREFLTDQGGMRSIWEGIQQRLAREENTSQKKKLPANLRFTVHLLLLDPKSSEGYFRYSIEKPQLKNHPKDIWDGLSEVADTQKSIYEGQQDFLRLRLFEHCPFSFVFFTNTTAFVEQYYYKTRTKNVPFPLIEYSQDSAHFNEVRRSLEVIWENGYEELPAVGTAIPLIKAGVKNIFRVDERRNQAKRQIRRISETEEGTIDVLTITGRHYVNDSDTVSALKEAASRQNVSVRLAILNPISQQAIFRSIADIAVTDKRIRKSIAEYDWEIHRKSRLYRRVYDTIREIQNWTDEGLAVELRLYSSSAGSALLLTPNAAFAGKYVYGRSKRLEGQAELQSEYPMFEFDAASCETNIKTELEILECTFRVIWNYYSVAVDDFLKNDDEAEFNKNLKSLQAELNWESLSPKSQ